MSESTPNTSSLESCDILLANPPTDGISALDFFSNKQLCVASWDGTVSLYDIDANKKLGSYSQNAAVLDIALKGDSEVFSGGLDLAVMAHDFSTNTSRILGLHKQAVKCVEYSTAYNVLISGSWDSTIKLWDIRAKPALPNGPDSPSSTALAATIQTPDRVYSMTQAGGNVLLVATASRHVQMYDIRKLSSASLLDNEQSDNFHPALIEQRESSLRHQTRCVRAFPDGSGFATGSIDGRVAIDFIDSSQQESKYAFKCHRKKHASGEETIFPVHAIAFNNKYGTFATGGGDGSVCIWDAHKKKRVSQFKSLPNSISALAFSPDSSKLAIALSYTWEHGDIPHPEDSILIKKLSDQDIKPKEA